MAGAPSAMKTKAKFHTEAGFSYAVRHVSRHDRELLGLLDRAARNGPGNVPVVILHQTNSSATDDLAVVRMADLIALRTV